MVSDLAEVWDMVIRPTLIDYAGDAWFLSTPKGRDDFAAMYDLGQSDDHPDWASWRFASTANPYLPADELDALRSTMTSRAYEQEIEARFIDELTDALWSNALIDGHRVARPPEMRRVVVAIDPAVSASADSDETGIVAAGLGVDDHAYVLADASGRYSPLGWASKAIAQYDVLGADRVIGEVNNGGDLIRSNLRAVRATVPYKAVRASRGKATRAEPVAAMYEQGRVHHVGVFPELELQMTTWSPQDDKTSPDRVDALVWALSELMVKRTQRAAVSVQG
jgi:phage terminase large subunit-like protein